MAVESLIRYSVTWGSSAMIAFAVGFAVVHFHPGDEDCHNHKCFLELEKRLVVLETAMGCSNNQCDRFKGKDGKELEARLRAEIATLRTETEERLDAM